MINPSRDYKYNRIEDVLFLLIFAEKSLSTSFQAVLNPESLESHESLESPRQPCLSAQIAG